jgi:hypothetical protein
MRITKGRQVLAAGLFFFLAVAALALKGERVELGNAGSYDGTVEIDRDGSGNMTFADQANPTPVPLSALAGSASQEDVEDYAGAMVSGNTETRITVAYDDPNGKLDFTVDNDLANWSWANVPYGYTGNNGSIVGYWTVNGGLAKVIGGQEAGAYLTLSADEEDQDIDAWSIVSQASGNALTFENDAGTALTLLSNATDAIFGGDVQVSGNDIKSNGGSTAISLSGTDATVNGDLSVDGGDLNTASSDLEIDPNEAGQGNLILGNVADGDKVGVGTASPTYLLTVAGQAGFDEKLYHNGDSDTYLYYGTNQILMIAGGYRGISVLSSQTIVNDNSSDYDFRVETVTDAYAIFADASTDRVGFGVSSPQEKVDISGNLKVSGYVETGGNEKFKVDVIQHTVSETDVTNGYLEESWSQATTKKVVSIEACIVDESDANDKFHFPAADDSTGTFNLYGWYDGSTIRVYEDNGAWAGGGAGTGDIVSVVVVYTE